jgi:hypothetical protein
MSSLVRLFVGVLLVSTVLLVSVPAVEAATVSMTGGEEDEHVTLTYQAAPGEANNVAVMLTTGAWIVSERGFDASGPVALTAGPGCTSLDVRTALCEHNASDITETSLHVVLVLGDSSLGGNLDIARASDACGPERWVNCQALIYGGEGPDLVFANDVDQVYFDSDEPSTVYGGPGADQLYAGEAGIRLIGGRGRDMLFGGPGRDMISGGDGEDTIRGGLRADELRGGAGADTFYARDGYRDRVFGGLGRDKARVDRLLDRVRSIERFF